MDSRDTRGLARVWVALAVAGLVGVVVAAARLPLDNNDVWIHLTTGRLILDEGRVPDADRYSFTAAGNRYVAHEWLAASLYALGERFGERSGLGSSAGVVAVAKLAPALAVLATLLMALAAVRAPHGLMLSVPLLALGVFRRRISARPELLAVPLLLATIGLLWRDREAAHEGRRTRAIWWLVPLEALWANLHGSFPLGVVVVLVFALAEAAQRLLAVRDPRSTGVRAAGVAAGLGVAAWLGTRQPAEFGVAAAAAVGAVSLLFALDGVRPLFRATAGEAGQGVGRLLALAAAMTAAIAVNPRGVELYAFPFEFTAADTLVTASVNEWKTLLGADHLTGSLALACFGLYAAVWCAALAIGAWRGRLGMLEVALLLALGILPLRHARWMGLFALATAPALVASLAALRATAPPPPPLRVGVALAFAAAGVALLGLAAGGLLAAPRDVALGISVALMALPALVGIASVAAPAYAGAGLPLTAGCALALAALSFGYGIPEMAGLAPRTPRESAQGPGFSRSLYGKPATDFLKRSGIGGRLFAEYEWAGYAIHQLWPSVTVFIDSRSEVYGDEQLRRFRRMKRDAEAARAGLESSGANLVLVRHWPYPAGTQTNVGILAAMRADPGWALLYVDDRVRLYARRDAERTLPPFLEVLDPDGFRIADPRVARRAFEGDARRALERAPGSAWLRLALAESLYGQGRVQEALAELERGWASNPSYAAGAQRAGEIEREAGRTERARRWFERAAAAAPDWKPPRQALEALPR